MLTLAAFTTVRASPITSMSSTAPPPTLINLPLSLSLM
jgi:hypothetical protein